jgi:hypothetical protein
LFTNYVAHSKKSNYSTGDVKLKTVKEECKVVLPKSATKNIVLKAGKHSFLKQAEEKTGVYFEKTGFIFLKPEPK